MDKKFFVFQEKTRLLCNMGKMKEVFEQIKTHGHEKELQGFWSKVTAQLGAALGDYALCDASLRKVEQELEKVVAQYGPGTLLAVMDKKIKYPGQFIAFLGLPGDAVGLVHPGQWITSLGMRQMGQWQLQSNNLWGLNQIAEIRFLRGLMALEAGDVDRAEEFFQSVENLVSPEFSFGDRAILTSYLREIEAARKKQ